ncbi:MAG: rhomboid family intramembrane serine protease [Bacteroidetes bacterium]|nr:rhomboid family intramembrane serine protease [Bacteroidota bacterium]
MYRITDVVKHLLIINILMYLGSWLMGSEPIHIPQPDEFEAWGRLRLALFFPQSEFFKPYQIVTHMFMHADLTHLFFNMFALFMFGPPLEQALGPKRFLIFYFVTGFGALLLHMGVTWLELNGLPVQSQDAFRLVNTPVLGASGAVFGLLAGFGMLFPNTRIMLLIPPIPMKAKYFVLIYAVLELFLGLGNFASGVAHFAHVGGALFGFLLILYWRRN